MTSRQLKDAPLDGITNVEFASNNNNLIVSSWDKTLRYYDTDTNTLLSKIETSSPLLDCCFVSDDTVISAGLDHHVYHHNLHMNTTKSIGTHANQTAVRCVSYSTVSNLIISGGWDGMLKFWSLSNPDALAIHSFNLSSKVFSLSVQGNYILVATADRRVSYFDIRALPEPVQQMESPLKHQTRAVQLFSDGYIITSVEGRAGVEYFEKDKKGFAFKCHRVKTGEQTQQIYPVNCVALHPYGTFATGGCDGLVCIWDAKKKKRVGQLNMHPTSVAAIDFNANGVKLAVASSYTFEQGRKDHPEDAIYIHTVDSSMVKPKQ